MNKRSYNILSFYLTKSLFIGGTISLLINTSKNTIIITSILGMLLGNYILYLLHNKSINNIIINIICILTILINLLSNNILTSNFLLNKTPIFIIMLLLITLIIYSTKKETSTIFNISSILIYLSIPIILLISLSLLPEIDITNLKPICTTNINNFINSIFIFTANSVFPNIPLLKYKNTNKYRDISKGYILGCINIIIIMFFILTSYGYTFASILRFPEYIILKKININYLSNLENILVIEWIITLIISSIFSFKTLKENINNKLYYLIILIIIILELIIPNTYTNILLIKKYYSYFYLIIIGLAFICTKKSY